MQQNMAPRFARMTRSQAAAAEARLRMTPPPPNESGCPAAPYQPPAPRDSRCIVLYDRHIEKNGGSTMRVIMRRLEEHGECAYWGYAQSHGTWKATMSELRSPTSPIAPPRLCIEAHTGLAASMRLAELGRLQQTLQALGSGCRVLRTARIRAPLSHYISFFTWGVLQRHKTLDVAGSRLFVQWANATPNLQASLLLNPPSARAAVPDCKETYRGQRCPSRDYESMHKPERLANFATGSDRERRRLADLLRNIDLLSPLDQFEGALLLTAEALGLHHVQHHAVNTCVGVMSERVNLDDVDRCQQLERGVSRCTGRDTVSTKRCAPQLQAECEAAVRAAAPLDQWLYEQAHARFRESVANAGDAFAARLRAFSQASRGVWRGGPPRRARCKFVRIGKAADVAAGWRELDFARHPCTPGPQAVMKGVTVETKYDRHALIVPNVEACLSEPLSANCSVPLQS